MPVATTEVQDAGLRAPWKIARIIKGRKEKANPLKAWGRSWNQTPKVQGYTFRERMKADGKSLRTMVSGCWHSVCAPIAVLPDGGWEAGFECCFVNRLRNPVRMGYKNGTNAAFTSPSITKFFSFPDIFVFLLSTKCW